MTPPAALTIGARRFVWEQGPFIMGIINVTPDSFSDGGRYCDVAAAVQHARHLAADGADLIDVGGESTRPGSARVDIDEELRRVIPVIAQLHDAGIGPLSIDTYKPEVAQAALSAGAHLVNDISGLTLRPRLAEVVARAGVPLVVMHTRGDPKTMQSGAIAYRDVVAEVRAALQRSIAAAAAAGVDPQAIIVDPGIGFGKLCEHNLALTAGIPALRSLGHAVLYGPSRKSFLGQVTGRAVDDRDRATAAVCAIAGVLGADILRVHDVRAVSDAVKIARALRPLLLKE